MHVRDVNANDLQIITGSEVASGMLAPEWTKGEYQDVVVLKLLTRTPIETEDTEHLFISDSREALRLFTGIGAQVFKPEHWKAIVAFAEGLGTEKE